MARKASNKKSFHDVMKMRNATPVTPKSNELDFEVIKSGLDLEINDKIKAYNEHINTIDTDYSSVRPRGRVLVRMVLKEIEIKNGVLYPEYDVMFGETKSGIQQGIRVENPFPFSTKAIIISAPDGSALETGEVVLLNPKAVKLQVTGRGDDGTVRILNQFIHPDHGNPTKIVLDPSDKNYGYVTVDDYEIEFKL